MHYSIGHFLKSETNLIRAKLVEAGLLNVLVDSAESAKYIKIKRVSNSLLQQIDPELFKYNDNLAEQEQS